MQEKIFPPKLPIHPNKITMEEYLKGKNVKTVKCHKWGTLQDILDSIPQKERMHVYSKDISLHFVIDEDGGSFSSRYELGEILVSYPITFSESEKNNIQKTLNDQYETELKAYELQMEEYKVKEKEYLGKIRAHDRFMLEWQRRVAEEQLKKVTDQIEEFERKNEEADKA